MARIVTEQSMDSRRREAFVIRELTEAIGRAHDRDGDITCIEVIAALVAVMARYIALERKDEEQS